MIKYIYVIVICSLSVSAYAAPDSTETKKQTLTLAAIYGSNANYYGQTTDQRLPYVLSNATFSFPAGFYLSASAYKLLNLGGSEISAADLAAGFDFNFTRRFTGGIGYTRSLYPENSPLLQAANENTVSGSLGYDWNILSTSVDADYAFGNQQDVFVTLSNSKLISLGSVFGDKGYFTVEPAIDVVGGTQHYLEEYIIRKNNRDKLIDLINSPFTPPGLEKQTETTTVAKSSFDLLSYNLNLPIGYNRSNYLVEAGYQVSVPDKKVSDDWQKPRSFFNVSFYYQF
ncbi:MAG TPA: hypothetical protein VGE26_06635 [Sphingobacteriaceae bacterium]